MQVSSRMQDIRPRVVEVATISRGNNPFVDSLPNFAPAVADNADVPNPFAAHLILNNPFFDQLPADTQGTHEHRPPFEPVDNMVPDASSPSFVINVSRWQQSISTQPPLADDESVTRRLRDENFQKINNITIGLQNNTISNVKPIAVAKTSSTVHSNRQGSVGSMVSNTMGGSAASDTHSDLVLPIEPANWNCLARIYGQISQDSPNLKLTIDRISRANTKLPLLPTEYHVRIQSQEFADAQPKLFEEQKYNANFTVLGHQEIVAERADLFQVCGEILHATNHLVLVGNGGVGKTHAAMQLAFRKQNTHLTWVLDASNVDGITAGYSFLAQHLGLDIGTLSLSEIIFDVHNVLCDGVKIHDWTLVFDDVASEAELKAMIPGGLPLRRGTLTWFIIITSRSSAWDKLARSVVTVEPFTDNEANAHLVNMLPSISGPDVNMLSSQLKTSPICLDLAARYISCQSCTVVKYVQQFYIEHATITRELSEDITPTQAILLSVIKITMGHITPKNDLARMLLLQLSVLPSSFFRSSVFSRIASFLGFVDDLPEALFLLTQLGLLLTRQCDTEKYYRLPRGIIEVLQFKLSEQDRMSCYCTLLSVFKELYNPLQPQAPVLLFERQDLINETKFVCEKALSVGDAVLGCIDELSLLDIPEVLIYAGAFCFETSRADLALWFLSRAAHVLDDMLTRSHIQVTATVNNIVSVLASKFDYAGAASLATFLGAMYITRFGPHHPEVAITNFRIACYLVSANQHTVAIDFFRKALEIQLLSDRRDPKITMLKHNIGLLYGVIGEYTQAFHFLRECLIVLQQSDRYIDIACTYNTIGCVWARRDLDSALEYHAKAQDLLMKQFPGSNHELIGVTFRHMARIYSRQGHKDKALEMHRAQLNLPPPKPNACRRSNCFLSDNLLIKPESLPEPRLQTPVPASASTQSESAILIREVMTEAVQAFMQLDTARALDTYSLALQICQTSKDVHREAIIHFRIACIHESLSESDLALASYQSAERVCRRALGDFNPFLAELLMRLAEVWQAKGNYSAAIDACDEASSIFNRHFNQNNFRTKAAKSMLRELLQKVVDAGPGLQSEPPPSPAPSAASNMGSKKSVARTVAARSVKDDASYADDETSTTMGPATRSGTRGIKRPPLIKSRAASRRSLEIRDDASYDSEDEYSDYVRADWINFHKSSENLPASMQPLDVYEGDDSKEASPKEEEVYGGSLSSIQDYEILSGAALYARPPTRKGAKGTRETEF